MDHKRGLEHQLLHHRLDATAFGFLTHQSNGLGSRMLHPVAQGQFQAVARATQVHRKRAIAIHACLGTSTPSFLVPLPSTAKVSKSSGVQPHSGEPKSMGCPSIQLIKSLISMEKSAYFYY